MMVLFGENGEMIRVSIIAENAKIPKYFFAKYNSNDFWKVATNVREWD